MPVLNRSKYFLIKELVPAAIFNQFGDKSWWFLDKEAVQMLNDIRELFGVPFIVNNWHSGGQYKESGYRSPDTTTGGKLSQHKRGAAFDIKPIGMTPREIYDNILLDEEYFLKTGLTTLEDIASTPTWVHVDNRWTGMDKILIVKP